jgi:hypothetical protein
MSWLSGLMPSALNGGDGDRTVTITRNSTALVGSLARNSMKPNLVKRHLPRTLAQYGTKNARQAPAQQQKAEPAVGGSQFRDERR